MQIYPLVSIIIPVYNTEQYLIRCFNSIINQTYSNIEIIIINDGSTDNSLNICRDYSKKDNRIKIFSQINEGLSSALNKGLNLATGEWLIFVDSDDWIDLNAIEGLVEMVVKYPHVDLIRSYNRQISKEDTFISNRTPTRSLYSRDEFLESKKVGGFISSLFVKSIIVKENNLKFDTELKIKMDLVFTLKCVLNSKLIMVYDNIFYNYYIRENSLIRSLDFEKSLNHLKASELIYKYSLKFDNKNIKSYIKESINNGLTSFYMSIIVLLNKKGIKCSKKEFKHIIKEYLYKTDSHFYSLSFKNQIFIIITFLDYRIFKYIFYIKYLKKYN